MKKELKPVAFIGYGLAILFFVAILNLGYAYYQLLRILSFLGILYLLLSNLSTEDDFASITNFSLIAILILFNPLFPIYLEKSIWVVLDIISAILMVIVTSIMLYKGNKRL